MSKTPTLKSVLATLFSKQALNYNFTAISNKFLNTLSLDGSTPNAMQADLDMNSNNINNVGTLTAKRLDLDGQTLSTPALSSMHSGAYQASSVDLQTADRMKEISVDYPIIYLPSETVETDQTFEWTLNRGTANNDKDDQLKMLIGTGGLIKYTGTDWAIKNTNLSQVYPRQPVQVNGVHIELTNANAKGGIRLFNVHQSLVCFNNIFPSLDVVQGGIGIFMDAFGDSLIANSNGGCNQNLVAFNKVGRDLDPFNDDGTTDYLGSIAIGILFAGSRAIRATAGQNRTIGNKIFNFANVGIGFSGCEPDLNGLDATAVRRLTPTYDYRIAEGAVGNYCQGDTMVCQRTSYAARLSDRETYLGTFNRPPVGYLYDARNGLTINDCHLERVGIPILVTHGSDRELCMLAGNQITNCGFVNNDGVNATKTLPSISNINKPVLEKYPDSSFDGAGMPSGYTFTTFMDPTDKTHYINGNEFLSAIPSQSLLWAALSTPANEDPYFNDAYNTDGEIFQRWSNNLTTNPTVGSLTNVSDLLNAIASSLTGTTVMDQMFNIENLEAQEQKRKNQLIFPNVDYSVLTIGG